MEESFRKGLVGPILSRVGDGVIGDGGRDKINTDFVRKVTYEVHK